MRNRYPGPQSFREEDEQLFHGRQKERKALLDLVLAQPVVVLFSKSGMGKTSLLQAGILPRLRFSEFDPVLIRLNQTDTPLETQALNALAPAAGATLWEAVKNYNREQAGGVPLLIFDQFEEIFTLYGEEQRAPFVRQLADLINGTMPAALREQLRAARAAGTLSDAEALALEQAPRFKIILSIRSDLLHYLHLLSAEIPSILRNRFELLGLKPDQARDAIILPAAAPRELGDYTSPAFSYSPDAVDQIIGYLGRNQNLTTGEPEIETFQLQLLCEHIERLVVAQTRTPPSTPPPTPPPPGRGARSSHDLIPSPEGEGSGVVGLTEGERSGLKQGEGTQATVTPALYGGEAGIGHILSEFYGATLEKIADPGQRALARRFIEDRLVQNGRRVSVDELTSAQAYGVLPATLGRLVNLRLLRRDVRETGHYYEISHDTLLSPIQASREKYEAAEAERRAREAEALALEEQQKREAAEHLQHEAETQRARAVRFTRLAIGVSALALLLAGAAAWSYWQADKARDEARNETYEANYSNANFLRGEGNYPAALAALDEARPYANPDQLRDLDTLEVQWTLVQALTTEADTLMARNELRTALEKYRQALDIAHSARLRGKVDALENELEIRFERYHQAAAGLMIGGGRHRDIFCAYIREALKLKPDDPEVLEKARRMGCL